MMNEKFKAGMIKAKEVAAQQRAERERDERRAAEDLRNKEQRRLADLRAVKEAEQQTRKAQVRRGVILGALLGGFIGIGSFFPIAYWLEILPVVRWEPTATSHPSIREQVVVTTHKGWVAAYRDEQGDFRDINNGEIVRGSHYWYRVPKRP